MLELLFHLPYRIFGMSRCAQVFASAAVLGSVWLAGHAVAMGQQTGQRNTVGTTLVEPSADMPIYQISRLRIERGSANANYLMFEFAEQKSGTSIPVEVVARVGSLSTGEKLFAGLGASGSATTYRIRLGDTIAKQIEKEGVEVCLIGELLSSRRIDGRFVDTYYRFKLSNSQTLGGAKERFSHRTMNEQERQRIQAWLTGERRKAAQKDSMPEGYVLYAQAKRHKPGMSAMYYEKEKWHSAELLGKTASSWIVLRPSPNGRETKTVTSYFVAIRKSDVERERAKPNSFTPSLTLVPGLDIPIPEGFVLKAELTKTVPGTPVKAKVGRKVVDAFTQSEYAGDVTIFIDQAAGKTIKVPHEHIMIASRVLSWLSEEDAEQRFAKYLSPENTISPLEAAGILVEEPEVGAQPNSASGVPMENGQVTIDPNVTSPNPSNSSATQNAVDASTPTRKTKRYPIKLAIPKGMRVVTASTPLQRGTKLGCSWGSKWYPVTVLGWYPDSAVRIRWDTFGDHWDTDMLREDLVISDAVLRKLNRRAKSVLSGPRLWTDKSGKFTVLAYGMDVSEGALRLRKPDGAETTIAIDKLSEKDQDLIEASLATKNR